MRPTTPTPPSISIPAASPGASSTCSSTAPLNSPGYRQLLPGSMNVHGGNSSSNSGGARTSPEAAPHHKKTNTRVALAIFFKGLFGAGVLAIPGAFSSVGVPLGLLIFLVVSVLCLCTMLMLLRCKELLREERGIVCENYEEVMGAVFGPRAFRVCRFVMSVLTLIFCTAFVIVISSSLHDVFPAVPRAAICAIIFPVLTLLSWLPSMKNLWLVSLVGLAVYLCGVVATTTYYAATNYHPPPAPMEWKWEGIPHFYGVAIYGLEGINLTLPVAASMKSLRKPPFVMTLGTCAFAAITAFYSAFAYSAGLGNCDIIIQCLGQGHFVQFVRVALALSLLATHPVYLIVASEIFERALFGGESLGSPVQPPLDHGQGGATGAAQQQQQQQQQQQKARVNKARLIRAVEVFLTCLVGGLVPNLGAFTSLVGATFVTLIGFLFPAAMWLELQREDVHASRAVKLRVYCVAGLVMVAGVIAMVVGTVEGIKNLRK